jgi:hypothetical protein
MEQKSFIIKRPKIVQIKNKPEKEQVYVLLYSSFIHENNPDLNTTYSKIIYKRNPHVKKYPLYVLDLYKHNHVLIKLHTSLEDELALLNITPINYITLYNKNNIKLILCHINSTDSLKTHRYISILSHNFKIKFNFKNIIENTYFSIKLKTLLNYSFLI